jgi:hypothetical protein
MNTVFEEMGVADLIDRYAEAAARHGAATSSGAFEEANESHDEIAAIYRELRCRGPADQRALLPLLDRSDAGVRLWAASHALEFCPEEGERALEALHRDVKGLIGFSAGMTLEQWRTGTLSFP